mmetsp:Transcript_19603/g.40335  ORF Transcript_19603/g.40335 Transcript_19603/m.40335 type:complete len:125 (-) Transcript_19603:29-403(-)
MATMPWRRKSCHIGSFLFQKAPMDQPLASFRQNKSLDPRGLPLRCGQQSRTHQHRTSFLHRDRLHECNASYTVYGTSLLSCAPINLDNLHLKLGTYNGWDNLDLTSKSSITSFHLKSFRAGKDY